MKEIFLSALNLDECARYLGYKGNTPDENILKIMKECEEQLVKTAVPRFLYKKFQISSNDDGVEVVLWEIRQPLFPHEALDGAHHHPEPAAQTHMPPPPELMERFRKVRHIEILAHGDAQHPRQTQDHVNDAGKVAVQLQRIQQHGRQRIRASVGLGVGADGADDHTQTGRNDQLLQQSPQCPGSTVENPIPAHAPLTQTDLEPVIPLDRAGKQVGKVSHKQGVAEKVPLRGVLGLIYIHQIGNDLQGEVGNAQHGEKTETGQWLELDK